MSTPTHPDNYEEAIMRLKHTANLLNHPYQNHPNSERDAKLAQFIVQLIEHAEDTLG